jgi:hypothetical protein
MQLLRFQRFPRRGSTTVVVSAKEQVREPPSRIIRAIARLWAKDACRRRFEWQFRGLITIFSPSTRNTEKLSSKEKHKKTRYDIRLHAGTLQTLQTHLCTRPSSHRCRLQERICRMPWPGLNRWPSSGEPDDPVVFLPSSQARSWRLRTRESRINEPKVYLLVANK